MGEIIILIKLLIAWLFMVLFSYLAGDFDVNGSDNMDSDIND